MKTYHAVYERGDGLWLVSVKELAGCHSQGRSLGQARDRIIEALGLYDVEIDGTAAQLVDDVRLPGDVNLRLKRLRATRAKTEAAQLQAQKVVLETVRDLVEKQRLSLRDVSSMVGLSHQRVQQLMKA